MDARGACVLAVAAVTLAGCSAVGDYLSHNTQTPQIGPQGIFTPSGPAKESEKIVKLPASAADVDCPEVDVQEGGATDRVGGPASEDVRYQFDINDVARECDPQGAQFALKVGVSGRLLIGPAGTPGDYSTTLHVRVTREADKKALYDKAFRVAANTQGADSAQFRLVTEPILLPLTRARLDVDYSIEVGLGQGAAVATHHRRARRHGSSPVAGAD